MSKKVLMVVSFVCNDDITVDVVFNDGSCQHIDIGAFVRRHPHPQYDKYLDPALFRKCKLQYGNLSWGNDLEFHIEDLHSNTIFA